MSDASCVESDIFSVEAHLRALTDTEGMSYPQKAFFWLEAIARKLHQGPRVDTWSSARDDAAEFAEIPVTMAQRIWQRWHCMQSVDGEALLKLMIAYEKICEIPEAKAQEYRAERLRLRSERLRNRGQHAATKQGPALPGIRMGAAHN